jgi:hypothetical protein
VQSLVMVPTRRQDPIGAIGSYWASRHDATPEEVRILQALADSTSVAMENVRFIRELEEGRVRTRAIYGHLPNPTFVSMLGVTPPACVERRPAGRARARRAPAVRRVA